MNNEKLSPRWRPLRWRLHLALSITFFSHVAGASAPHFTGLDVLTPATGGTVNLRSQGAVTGSAPMTVESVSVLPLGLAVQASVVEGVCVQVTNALGIDLASAGALLSVVVSNPQAPRGVRGVIALRPGLANNNDLEACADPSRSPVADAGGHRTVADTDGAAGEAVALDASRSFDPDGTIVSYEWTDLTTQQTLGTGVRIQPRLTDGEHQIRLTVTDDSGGPEGSASTTINVIVQTPATSAPTPNAGADRTLLDTDGIAGELVTLDASASIDVGGQIGAYEWFDSAQNLLGQGISLTVRLPDGSNDITLRVTGSNLLTHTTTVNILIAAPLVDGLLSSIPDLSPNQREVATALDGLCTRLEALAAAQTLSPEQLDLLNRCNGIIDGADRAAQIDALDELGASDFSAIRTQAIVFSSQQYSGIMSRLALARAGGGSGRATQLDWGGTHLTIDGKPVPIHQLQTVAKQLWTMFAGEDDGGGSGQAEETLLSDRLGLWLRSNYDRGEKAFSPSSEGFKGKQWGLTGGVDYRFGRHSIAGVAFGYGTSDVDFRRSGRGGVETTSWIASLYGSAYMLGDLYLDAVINYAQADYDTTRRIAYSEGGTPIDRTALGSTDGTTLSAGLSLGYDWSLGGWTLSPALGYFHARARIDPFDESGAGGLELAYGKQRYRSSTANLSFSVVYAWSTPWLVLSPHLRGEYLHEFNDDIEVFGVHFAHDPFAQGSDPTPPIVVRSDVPDQWYWRAAAGVSAQFKHGISGFIEYQRLEDFRFVSFENFAVGLRFQRSL